MITTIVLCLVFGLPILSGIMLILCSLIAFNANVIQYGMDHLCDAPTDKFVLCIHWYIYMDQ